MKKTIYLIRGLKTESYLFFKQAVFSLVSELNRKYNFKELKLVLTENAPPLLSIIPFKKKKIAVISICSDEIAPIEEIQHAKGFAGSYEVIEVLPVAYTKNWEDGMPTPGICLLTLFKQKRGIDYDTFINRWHNSHTPLSLKLHPLWHYNRNVVEKQGNKNIENWDGIVEEHCRTRAELLNPFKFFGKPVKIIPNMIHVYRDTKSFLDYKTIEPYVAVEYHIKSQS